jgi:DAK2 domain fusion protein YloV
MVMSCHESMVIMIVSNMLCDGRLLRRFMIAGQAWLHHNHERVNAMNVFPVPDGDTGTNMLLTMQRAVKEIQDYRVANVALVAERLANGALMGARGNSGTILSMLIRGFAIALDGHSRMDASLLISAMRHAVDHAYKTVSSVMEPVEGTILTVARDVADALPQDEHDMRTLLNIMVHAANESLQRTPELLPVLKEAGVVDSGGMGLLMLFEGMQRWLDGEKMPQLDTPTGSNASIPMLGTMQEGDEDYGYDVQFLMIGDALDVEQIQQDIAAMGWSPLVHGDNRMIKVHIHVHDPGKPLSYAIASGAFIDDIVVENMQQQADVFLQNRSQVGVKQPDNPRVAVIAVVNGDGLSTIFEEYGATQTLIGGQTMNPSTDDFLQLIQQSLAHEIILLPNNSNIIMTAEQVAHASPGKDVRVVPTRTIPQGIQALLAYNDWHGEGNLDDMVIAMQERAQQTLSAEITNATRTITFDGVMANQGDYIGLLNGKIVVADADLDRVLEKFLQHMQTYDVELATFYYGAQLTSQQADAFLANLREKFPELEYEILAGGQPLYPFIMSFE